MSTALNGSSTLEHFERSNTSEIRNGIMFNFYPGLPYIFYSVTHNGGNQYLSTWCSLHGNHDKELKTWDIE